MDELTTNEQARMAFAQRDLWKEARDRSASYRGAWLVRALSWILHLLFPKRFKDPMIFTFGIAGERLMCVDLNKYRPDVDVEMLIDQGVKVFMLRVGGPKAWIYPTEFVVDDTFVPYYTRIRAYAKLKGVIVYIIGYGVHDAFAGEEGNYVGLNPQVKWLKEATRNHICDLYAWDDEVAKIWKSTREVTITSSNLVKSISQCMDQTWTEMERWPTTGYNKMVVHYSANWFMKTYAPGEYQAWLDRADADIDNRRLMTWRAWLPTVFSEVFALISQLFDKVITPTGVQENAFLRMGSELAADLWQCSFTAKGPWCGPQSASGIDVSIGYGPSATITDFIYCANLPEQPPDEPPPPPPPPDGDLAQKVAANTAAIAVLETQMAGVLSWPDKMKAAV